MYERYLSTHNIPAGAVLQHILRQTQMSQKALAYQAGLPTQRINDFIHGKRRISAESSLRLEEALSIRHKGFFYTIQSNHDIFNAVNNIQEPTPDLSKIRQSIFWDTEMSRIQWQRNAESIIRRVFEYGDNEAIDAIIDFYGRNKVKNTLAAISDSRLESRRRENAKRLFE